jgi:WD40 repeat protein
MVQLYELHKSEGKFHARLQRTLEFGEYLKRPHGEPHTLSFSPDGSHITCTSSVRGGILTWNLDKASQPPSFRTVIPGVNDGMVSLPAPLWYNRPCS